MQNSTLNLEKNIGDSHLKPSSLLKSRPTLRLVKNIEDYTDNELVESFLAENNELAFNEIFERYYGKIKNFALKKIYNPDEAEEIVQEIFVKLLTNLDKFRGESKFSTWLYAITMNTIRMWLRDNYKHKKNLSLDDDNSLEEYSSKKLDDSFLRNPEDIYMNSEFVDRFRKALDLLSPKYRDTLILDLEQYTNVEIADRMQISVPAVKSRLNRARKQLRTNFKNH